jgi:Carboxypeptidase regulatory-like domain/TonB-dependent Receptor Plug Domain
MRFARAVLGILFLSAVALSVAWESQGQSGGNSVAISGTIADQSGAVIPGATVTIHNPVSGFESSATTDASGNFTIPNVPFNPYHLTVTAKGFSDYVQDVDVRSAVSPTLKITLQLAGTTQTVTVEGGNDLIENDPTAHTDIDRKLFEQLPLESQSSSLSSLVTLASPGVAADSNGLFHGLGDHAENSFSVDGQPITDQQSKVFSNQIPIDAVQSLEVIDGAPPAEYGDKTSLVIDVTTRSGEGMTTPHGDVTGSYGSFGSSNLGFNFGYGGQNWGNFISVSGLNTSRFLDPPEFTVMHDKGNQENVFDRVDYRLNQADSLQLNFDFTRSWFQTPNSYDSEFASPWFGVIVNDGGIGPTGEPVGPADQRSQIQTFNIAPTWTHVLSPDTVFTTGAWVRRDAYNYYPSGDPFSDLGPFSLQRESVGQDRTLTNAGLRASISYVKGINNLKAGISYEQTFLNEIDRLGIVDPTFNAPCLADNTNPYTDPFYAFAPVQGITNPSQCPAGDQQNVALNPNAPGNPANGFLSSSLYPLFSPTLLPYDLTRGGSPYTFNGHTDVKELAMYVEDSITEGNWNFNLGIRGDVYNGLSRAQQAEPRLGIAYNVKQSNTVLRVSYARTLETPFNENLVLSSIGCSNPVLGPQDGIPGTGLLGCSSSSLTPITPGYRNEFHAGLQQAFGGHVVFDGEYIWKYTHNGYDFSVLGNTPITFPIEWARSKIPGFTGRLNITNVHGITAQIVMSSVAARFFLPQVAGAGANPSAPTGVFRIDHDEQFNQTTHLQYQPSQKWPWLGFNWRYDSGLVAGATPCFGIEPFNTCPGSLPSFNGETDLVSLVASNVGSVPLSAGQEFEAGFTCNGVGAVHPTAANPAGIPLSSGGVVGVCPATNFGSNLIKIPGPNAEQDDKNPPRIQQRNLFDLAIGDDNLFHGDRYKWSLTVTVINVANNYALYNFLSTFSGTHYVTPRTVTGQLGFHF